MKNKWWIILITYIILIVTACGMEKPLTEDEIKNNDTVISYFASYGMDIVQLRLEDRYTLEEQKTDIAYCYISAESEQACIQQEFAIGSSCFEKAGWTVQYIEPVETLSLIPKEPDFSAFKDDYEIVSVSYESGSWSCEVQYNKISEYPMGMLYETIENRFYFSEGKWNLDFEDYEKEDVINKKIILNDSFITGTWYCENSLGDKLLIEVLCHDGYLDICRWDENGYVIYINESMVNVPFGSGYSTAFDNIPYGWYVPELSYEMTESRWYEGEIMSTYLIVEPDLENSQLIIYTRYNVVPLTKIN